MPKVRTISVNLSAGTAKFFADMDAAGAKIKEFGGKGVSEARATAAAMKELEGGFTGNARAVDGFLEKVLGLGPVMKLAFPVVGALAFGAMLVETGTKLYEFYKKVREGPERTTSAFRTLNDSLRLTNDELAVANDRLTNDIAKLEGKHQNTLKLALDEARMAADKLADSLEKDLKGVYKLLKEQEVGFWGALGSGKPETKWISKWMGGETGNEGVTGRINEETDKGNAAIRGASSPAEATKARDAMNAALLRIYKAEIAYADGQLARLKEESQPHMGLPVMQGGNVIAPGTMQPGQDHQLEIALLAGARRNLAYQQDFIPAQAENVDKTGAKEGLEARKENARADAVVLDRMKLLRAQIAGVQKEMEAIGKGEQAQILAKAWLESTKAIEETNKALEHYNKTMTPAQEAERWAGDLKLASIEAEKDWKTKLEASTTATEDRIRSQNLLTAAIGRGYEATRTANVETRLMQELGQHYGDSAWMQSHAGDVAGLRAGFGQEFDAGQAEKVGASIQRLTEQIRLEKDMASAQAAGAEAVRQAALAAKLRQIALENSGAAAKKLMAAEIELYAAERANVGAEVIAKLNEKIAATERLTRAILGGAEAERKAGLENKYAEMRRSGPQTAVPGVIGVSAEELAARTEDAAARQLDLQKEALKTGLEYRNQVEHEKELIGILDAQLASGVKIDAQGQEQKLTEADILAIEISRREEANKLLDALAKQQLQLGTLRSGVKAFFLEMQQDAQWASHMIYDALNSALERTAGNLTKLLTRQKTAWAAEFKEIGDKMLDTTLKAGMKAGLGELAKHIDPKSAIGKVLGLVGGKPDGSSADKALWVRMAGTAQSANPWGGGAGGNNPGTIAGTNLPILLPDISVAGPGGIKLGGGPMGGSQGGGIFSALDNPANVQLAAKGITALATKFSGAAAAAPGAMAPLADSADWAGFMAEGGPVDPGHSYTVGDSGQETFVPNVAGRIVPNRGSGGDTHYHTYSIDARGAQLGVMNEIMAQMHEVHKAAVAHAVQAVHERSRRTPQ